MLETGGAADLGNVSLSSGPCSLVCPSSQPRGSFRPSSGKGESCHPARILFLLMAPLAKH